MYCRPVCRCTPMNAPERERAERERAECKCAERERAMACQSLHVCM